MINVVSRQASSPFALGPLGVLNNLLRGLDRIGYPYVVNRELTSTRRLWIHDDLNALRCLPKSDTKVVVGPNLCVLPEDLPAHVNLNGCLVLQPSRWAVEVWRQAGFFEAPIAAWPVGVDTDRWVARRAPEPNQPVLVYHKERDPSELTGILDVLRARSIAFTLVRYGSYREDEYRSLLGSSSFAIWHGCHESQGLALEQALASDVPVLVCDVTRLSQAEGGYPFGDRFDGVKVTAAPYFDDRCGMRIENLENVGPAIDAMIESNGSFAPREFVLERLSLTGQARRFVDLWQQWGLPFEEGLRERCVSRSPWREPLTRRAGRVARRVRSRAARVLIREHRLSSSGTVTGASDRGK